MVDNIFRPYIPGKVLRIIRRLEGSGYSAWLVGGAVRDILQGKDPDDWDMVVNTGPDGIKVLFPGAVCVGRDKGISCHMTFDGLKYEISPLKGENIHADLGCRDFTINSMAFDSGGQLIDPFGGENDLEVSILRFTGDPEKRINEDPVRLLRMCRFASSMNLTIPDTDMDSARINGSALTSVSSERVGEEVLKGLGGRCNTFIGLVHRAGFTEKLFPFFPGYEVALPHAGILFISPLQFAMKMWDLIQKGRYPSRFSHAVLFLPLFLQGVERPEILGSAEGIMVRWGWPAAVREEVHFYAGYTPGLLLPPDGKLIYRIHMHLKQQLNVDDLFCFAELLLNVVPRELKLSLSTMLDRNRRMIAKAFPLLDSSDIFIPGGEIADLFSISPGPLLGKLRESLAIEIAEGNIWSREGALDLIRDQLLKLNL